MGLKAWLGNVWKIHLFVFPCVLPRSKPFKNEATSPLVRGTHCIYPLLQGVAPRIGSLSRYVVLKVTN